MAAAADLYLPPGFRFHPTDEELVSDYLCRKCANHSIAAHIIAEIDLYKHDPWDLPALALYGEKEWYFFSPRDRKYPNGSRPNRGAGHGYWKATGADKPIGHPKPVGIKKALVFYSGKAPRGEKTNWIMHEYRLADVDRSARKNSNSLRLDEWVLCRIYNKKGTIERRVIREMAPEEDTKPVIPAAMPEPLPTVYEDFMFLDASESLPRLPADSGCSEQVRSPEVESVHKMSVWERSSTIDFPFDYGGESLQFQGSYQMEPMSEVFGYMSKPF